MRFILLHFLKAIWRERIAGFWPIWIAMTGAAAIGVAWVVRRPAAPTLQVAKQTPATETRRNSRPAGTIAALTLLAVGVVCFIALTLKWEDFADYDDAYYTTYTLKGLNFAPPIWPEIGRFFRLAIRSSIWYATLPPRTPDIMSCRWSNSSWSLASFSSLTMN